MGLMCTITEQYHKSSLPKNKFKSEIYKKFFSRTVTVTGAKLYRNKLPKKEKPTQYTGAFCFQFVA